MVRHEQGRLVSRHATATPDLDAEQAQHVAMEQAWNLFRDRQTQRDRRHLHGDQQRSQQCRRREPQHRADLRTELAIGERLRRDQIELDRKGAAQQAPFVKPRYDALRHRVCNVCNICR